MNKDEFSIIIPVWREADTINCLIKNIIDQFNREKFEIIVVDGEKNGNTIDTIKIGSDNIKKITAEKNRAKQMNAGASVSNGDILIFLHADSMLPEGALTQIKNILKSNSHIVAGAFDLKLDSNKIIFKIISKVSSLRSRLTRIPYGDQAIFVQKEYFNKLSGYKEIPIMEDIDLMRRIKKNNGKIHILSSSVVTSPRRWEKEGILFCTFRNWLLISLYLLGTSPEKLKELYRNK